MVHINQVEFENFKSFGGNICIPLEEGFTVVTGPNGSGKSNILDGILFCLGLASSRGMRAERLPDLINTSKVKNGKSSETSVSVKFNLKNWKPSEDFEDLEIDDQQLNLQSDQKEWIVSRKLRLMPGGSYASTYTSDGKPCTLQQIQKLLRDIRVDPEGSNVVMQGDVTRIVTMTNKERRNLIDELAGVALFDSRIEQTHSKLNDVYERQERCEILQNELQGNRLKLEKECEKAKKYKDLKEKCLFLKELRKIVLFESQAERIKEIEQKGLEFIQRKDQLKRDSEAILKEIELLVNKFNLINSELKDKGEDELIKVNSDIGSINTNLRELDRLSELNKNEGIKLKENRDKISIAKKNIELEIKKLQDFDENSLKELEEEIKIITNTHKLSRKKLSEAVDQSGEFSKKNLKINNEIENLRKLIEPLHIKKRNFEEEMIENNSQREEISSQINSISDEKAKITERIQDKNATLILKNEKLRDLNNTVKQIQSEIDLLTKTISRLSNERLKLEKDLSRFESRREALNETRGSYALRILLEAGLEGIHGYVAQLGDVSEKYRYALEIAAGNRLGQIVVDNDHIVSKAIDILQRKKAGRLTFLPLNRLRKQSNKFSTERETLKGEYGFIDKAINLIDFDNVYKDVFNYVFGETKVFTDLSAAKSIRIKSRIVTLNGELLETSGAITGGSKVNKDLAYRFGVNNELDESNPIRERLKVINESINQANRDLLNKSSELERFRDEKIKVNDDLVSLNKELDLNKSALNDSFQKIKSNSSRLKSLIEANQLLKNNLDEVDLLLNPYQKNLNEFQLSLKNNHEKNNQSTFSKINKDFEGVDLQLNQLIERRDILLEQKNSIAIGYERLSNEQNLVALKEKNLLDAIKELAISHQDWITKRDTLRKDLLTLDNQKKNLEKELGIQRRKRDELNLQISNKRQEKNELSLKMEYNERDEQTLSEEKRIETIKLEEYKKDLPEPLPDFGIYVNKDLDYFETEISIINSHLEQLEPVNMLALEELEELQKRLNNLVERLNILSNERSELLLRIETVSTMRQEAFMEAFTEVDRHFREIFALLSDGDGFLQLENNNSPLEGGLTLVAHPKGKNVRRLASMSGGEKSLTALSFLFALQKYKPSPFYALDEVDSFLDGVNVERLSKLITSQSLNAQFIVVSHRRPMISASSRTIGVAQARGAHTQVIGLPNAA